MTPNLDELKILAGRKVRNLSRMKDAGRALVENYGCAFLLKGGHFTEGRSRWIFLATADGYEEFSAPFVRGVDTHWDGLPYSAAITASLAHGRRLPSVGAA